MLAVLIRRLIVVAALLLFFGLALDTAGRKSVTTDEPLHLIHAITLLQTGTMRIPEMHVPLTYRLAGELLRTEGALPDVTRSPSWATLNPYEIGREYLWQNDLPAGRLIWLGRFVVAGMGVLLGALMAAWTRPLTGDHRPATAVVLGLYALSPNLLAAAGLLTTDMAATVTWLACVYAWWRYWRRPGWGRWLAAAVCLGLALAAKLTGVLLLPVLLLLAYAGAWASAGRDGFRTRPYAWLRPGLVWLGLLPLAFLVLWAFYNFETQAGLPMPAYREAWRLLLTEVETSHLNFFFGQIAPTGSWLYFPATLLLKTPLLQLALFLLIPLALWRAGRRPLDRAGLATVCFLALPAAVLLAVAAASRLNFGYRHALPAVPFLMLLGGPVVVWLWPRPGRAGRAARVALALAASWTAVAALRTHPDHLTYFNELARGRGDRYLGDSNLDWGQDLNLLAAYARAYEAQTGRRLFFSYTGIADRARYGLDGPSLVEQFRAGDALAAANPPAGRYAINVSDLQGTGLTLGILDEIDLFDWFRRREPLADLGGSIYIYDVAEPAGGGWIAHCATPGRLLDDNAAERLVGRAGLRHLTFDCRSSWVWPEGPGWYVLPPGAAEWLDAWPAATPEPVYRHRANEYGPDYVIAYWPGACAAGRAGEAAWRACLPALRPHDGATGGPARLLAYGAAGAEWLTLWQVAAATAEPLSIQAHLTTGDAPPQVADGLGYAAGQWRPGDWFVQRHVFAAPGETLTTGLYNYVTLQPAGPVVRLPE